MKKISRKEGVIYYGEDKCVDIDDAYKRFRSEYHRSIGRIASLRLDRIGRRTERIHGYGFNFCGGRPFDDEFKGIGRTRYTMGLVVICYCRIIGIHDVPELSEEQFERWFDWAFSEGSGALRLSGKMEKSGRTSKRLKTRYK